MLGNADDHMVDEFDIDGPAGFPKLPSHGQVGRGRRRIPTWVVVPYRDYDCATNHGLPETFARMRECGGSGAARDLGTHDQTVTAIQ